MINVALTPDIDWQLEFGDGTHCSEDDRPAAHVTSHRIHVSSSLDRNTTTGHIWITKLAPNYIFSNHKVPDYLSDKSISDSDGNNSSHLCTNGLKCIILRKCFDFEQ